MGRFILRFTGRGPMPDADLAQVRSTKGVTVVDSSSPRMLLVEAAPRTVEQLAEALPGWACAAEQMVPLPNPRPRPRPS